MARQYFFGIENEFTLHDKYQNNDYTIDGEPHSTWQQISAPSVWKHLMAQYGKPRFRKGKTCIRTINGSSVYCDEEELEVCTPPISVRPGFTDDIKRSLYNARHDLAQLIDPFLQLAVVGYSMHWNMTRHFERDYILDEHVRREIARRKGRKCRGAESIGASTQMWSRDIDEEDRMRIAVAAPLGLFALTPNSVGVGLRFKEGRYELLGDHLPDEDQAGSFALLYAGMMLGIERRVMPIQPYIMSDMPLPNEENRFALGRASPIIISEKGHPKLITAQEHLERTYQRYRREISDISTQGEREMLGSFIDGKRELEIDRHGLYDRLAAYKSETGYDANPVTEVLLGKYHDSQPTTDSMSRFLGWIVKEKGLAAEMEWDLLRLRVGGQHLEMERLNDIAFFADAMMRIPEEGRKKSLAFIFNSMENGAVLNGLQVGNDLSAKETKRYPWLYESVDPPKVSALGEAIWSAIDNSWRSML